MRVADYIVEELHKAGANQVFMITGRGILYLSDAVAKNTDIKNVAMHHEQAAAYAACACAAYNGKIGACIVSTGCGATNAITGVLSAWQDQLPCVFISGQNYLKETVRYTGGTVRTYGQQENDIISLVKPITKYAVMLDNPQRAVYEIEAALYEATHGRKGPVWIDIPLDIQNARIEPEEMEHFCVEKTAVVENEAEKEAKLCKLKEELRQAKRPVLLAGWGIRNANAESEFCGFAENSQIPVVYTSAVPDLYTWDKDNSIGVVSSMGGSRAGNFAIQNADFVLSIGSRLSPMTTGEEYDKFVREGKLFVVDVDEKEHTKNTVSIDMLIPMNIKEFLQNLNESQVKPEWSALSEWRKKCIHWKELFQNDDIIDYDGKKIDLYYLAACLSNQMPKDSILCTDAGLEEVILPNNIHFKEGQRCIHPVSQGAMGFALPAAIGVQQETAATVIAVIGDGSIMMNLQELATIAYLNLPVKILVINNNGYSIIRKRQQDMFRTRTIGNDASDGVGIPDFERIANGFNIHYERIDEFEKLETSLQSVIAQPGAVICEIISEPNQTYIHCSYARNQMKKIVKRPLEDQSPYLEREMFLREMVITPINQ